MAASDITAALEWPWMVALDIDSSLYGESWRLKMFGDAIKLIEKKYSGPHGWHQHLRIRLSPSMTDCLELDEHEFTVAEWDVDSINVPMNFDTPMAPMYKKAGPGTVSLEGPGVKKIVKWAADMWNAGLTPPDHSYGLHHSYGVPQMNAKKYGKKHGKELGLVWVDEVPLELKKGDLTIAIPHVSGELPWHWQLELPGGGFVKVKVYENFGLVMDEVAIEARALMPLAADVYAAFATVAKQAIVSNAPDFLTKSVQLVVDKAVAGAQLKPKLASPSFTLSELIATNKTTELTPLTESVFKKAVSLIEENAVKQAELKASMSAVLPQLQAYTQAMEKAMEKAAAGAASAAATTWGKHGISVGAAFTASMLVAAAEDFGLAAVVGQAYPTVGKVLVGLAKFDGRPAEWEECEMLFASLKDVVPVGAELTVVPLTPELAVQLDKHAHPPPKVVHLDLGDPGSPSKKVLFTAKGPEKVVGWAGHSFPPVTLEAGETLKITVPQDEYGVFAFGGVDSQPSGGPLDFKFKIPTSMFNIKGIT